MQNQGQSSKDLTVRRRGRPAGRNRTPLSLEERRARNAQYERERRNETASALSELAQAAGCDPQMSNADILVTVISQLRRATKRKPSENIEDLKRLNESLESQIAELENRLQNNPESNGQEIIKKHSQEQQSETPDSECPTSDPFCNYKRRNITKCIKRNQKPKTRQQFTNQNKIDDEMLPETSSEPNSMESQLAVRIDTGSSDDIRSQAKLDFKFHDLPTKIQSQREQLNNQVKTMTSDTSEEEFQSENLQYFESQSVPTQYNPPPQCNIQAELHTPFEHTHTENTTNMHHLNQDSQPMTDLFTDREIGLIAEWMDCSDFLDIGTNPNPQVEGWSYEHFVSEYI